MKQMERDELKDRVRKIVPEIIDFRRLLHQHPEKGLEEHNTSKEIRKRLASANLEIQDPLIGTDTIVLLYGDGLGKNITLRADIDALALQEKSYVPWESTVNGLAHSCGHDGHTAVLMGTVLVLNELTQFFPGSVRFVFQPAEEQFGGGKTLVEKGLLESEPKPAAVYALHGWPELPLGTFSAKSGTYMAANADFSITIQGRGGHGGKPQLAIDPIVIGSEVVQIFQTIVSRFLDPASPVVISVCRFQAGMADNVIPDTAELAGTVRYFDPQLQTEIPKRMEAIIRGCCETAGADFTFNYEENYIPLVNDPEKTDFVRTTVKKYFGNNAWSDTLPITTSSEDFSFYLDKVPGTFIRLGLGGGHNLHNPGFDFNDDALEAGITLLCALVLESNNQ